MILPPSDIPAVPPPDWQLAIAGVTVGATIVAVGVTLAVTIGGW